MSMQKLISSVKNNIKKGYAMANHMTYYTNGTKCDLTGHPRTAVAKVRTVYIPAMAAKPTFYLSLQKIASDFVAMKSGRVESYALHIRRKQLDYLLHPIKLTLWLCH